jgi:aryl-alcohol dehydrogenase-like predicted oxidoreductase
MHYRTLGNTGLQVSVLALGSGGPNRFGQLRYVSRTDIEALVRRALDLGINYFDTASGYSGSETLLGEALRGVPRDRYHLSSKLYPLRRGAVLPAAEARQLVERSLRRLRVDALDILFLHRVRPQAYAETLERLLPVLLALRAEGKVRHLGVSESSKHDRRHAMLERALQASAFEVVMAACRIDDHQVGQRILPQAQARGVGVVGMVAARNLVPRNAAARLRLCGAALRSLVATPPQPRQVAIRLREALSSLRRSGPRKPFTLARERGEGVLELPELGYTYALSHPAVATVLTGTTNPEHLARNVRAALAPPLTPGEIESLRELLRRHA